MNDKYNQAFDKWHDENIANPPTLNELINKAWIGACEYKQKEIDKLKDVTYWTVEQDGKVTRHISIAEIEKLQAENHYLLKQLKHEHDLYKKHLKVYEDENAKLRECVEFYADLDEEAIGYDIRGVTYARQVLKELDNNQLNNTK